MTEENPSICKICGLKAHGLHFGVASCRPCAAFFRRCVVLNLKYDCLQTDILCRVQKKKNCRDACRDCRFQRCLQVGMKTDNIQFTGSQKNSTTKSRKLKTPSILEELINTDDQTPPPIPQLDVKLTPDAMTTIIRSFTSVLLANISSVVLANMPMNHMTTKATEIEEVSSTTPNFVSLR
ncbi:hypothetical protein GCK72_021535 [Caenorhabditis remanei]|uniref:Nuclear receptor domain-containing protein n=1 Tax=Caenorhabditis remanei TaxID=31234 RepID=A0A6A5GKV6_CAERE|nr:hypothetical protein GCK72_021535 [Caenorhabditis remanei]KAF1754969.1 hypothetical protein GCK72_021535 [Caenorhabditis remanei]